MLRIKDVPALHANHSPIGSMAPQTRRVEVTWQEGLRSRAAVSSFVYQVNERDAEKIRWYLEDFAEFRAQPAPLLAADAEARLADIGADLFSSVFSEQDAAGIWADAASELGQVRVEVNTNLAEVSELPWELFVTLLQVCTPRSVRPHSYAPPWNIPTRPVCHRRRGIGCGCCW